MKALISIITLVFLITGNAHAQVLNETERDSLRHVICSLADKDQQYRKGPCMDSVALARKNNDTAFLESWDKRLHAQDIEDINELCTFIKKAGFPCSKTLGNDTCDMIGILIHWSKEYPEWFNNDSIVKMLKGQIVAGNLRLSDVDMSYFFFISFIHPDIKYMALVNKNRIIYGLTPYSKDQYLGLKTVTPMMDENGKRFGERLPEQ